MYKLTAPITELAKDIARQRKAIQEKSLQMVEDIEYFLLSYMNSTGKTEIKFSKPYTLGNRCFEKITLEDNGKNGMDYDANVILWQGNYRAILKHLPAEEQAYIFEFFVQDIIESHVFVVLEEIYLPNDGTKTNLVGTFKSDAKAQKALHNRLCEIMDKYYEIWKQAQKENIHPKINSLNEYLICTSEYIYHIKILEQAIQGE